MSKENQEEFNAIYRNLATLRHDAPDSKEAQAAIKVWYDYLQNFGEYSLDAFKGLGQMYVADERFTKNIDKFGEGLAQFMCDAMEVYADRNNKNRWRFSPPVLLSYHSKSDLPYCSNEDFYSFLVLTYRGFVYILYHLMRQIEALEFENQLLVC